MALRRALPRWDRHGQSTSSQEILASLKALLLCDYDVSQFCDGSAHSIAESVLASQGASPSGSEYEKVVVIVLFALL